MAENDLGDVILKLSDVIWDSFCIKNILSQKRCDLFITNYFFQLACDKFKCERKKKPKYDDKQKN